MINTLDKFLLKSKKDIHKYLIVNSISLENVPAEGGIYLLYNENDRMGYVGQSLFLKKRITTHLKAQLFADLSPIKIIILEYPPKGNMLEREAYWIYKVRRVIKIKNGYLPIFKDKKIFQSDVVHKDVKFGLSRKRDQILREALEVDYENLSSDMILTLKTIKRYDITQDIDFEEDWEDSG